MANIKKYLEKEIEKGGKYVDPNGEILTEEKVENLAGKEYIKKLGKEIPMDYGFKKYLKEYKQNLIPVENVLVLNVDWTENAPEEVDEVDEKTE